MKIQSATKLAALLAALVLSVTVSAQEQNMQDLQAIMKNVSDCMKKVNQSDLKALEQEQKKMEPKVQALCNQGKRKQAQSMAMAFAKKMNANASVKQAQKCAKMAEGMMPVSNPFDMQKSLTQDHVCDQLGQ